MGEGEVTGGAAKEEAPQKPGGTLGPGQWAAKKKAHEICECVPVLAFSVAVCLASYGWGEVEVRERLSMVPSVLYLLNWRG